MIINFSEIQETVIPQFYGGNKKTNAQMFIDQNNKIMYGKLEPGASIGLHTHETSSEIIYILSGNGQAFYNGIYEQVTPGLCHYCPIGASHSLMNNGTEDLVFFAVVPEHTK